MQSVSHRGDLSHRSDALAPQSKLEPVHPSTVTARTSDPASRRGKQAYNALSASSVGLELGISVILGLLFGIFLDGKLGTEPWMMLLFLCVGLVAGFRGVLRAVKRSDRAAGADHG